MKNYTYDVLLEYNKTIFRYNHIYQITKTDLGKYLMADLGMKYNDALHLINALFFVGLMRENNGLYETTFNIWPDGKPDFSNGQSYTKREYIHYCTVNRVEWYTLKDGHPVFLLDEDKVNYKFENGLYIKA